MAAFKFLLLAVVAVQACFGVEVGAPVPGLLDVLTSLQLTTFVDGLKKCGLDRIINHEGHFTLFAPNNDAFKHEKWYPGEDDFCSKMSIHIARGYYKQADLQDEQVIKSLLSKRTVRLNIYPFKNNLLTANGRPVVDTDHLARNGVVHVVSEVMSSVYARAGSVVSEIDECCPEHSDLIELLKLSGMYNKLDKEGPFTLLAPNNGAFAKLHPDFIIHLKKNLTAMVNLLSGHVIPLTYYSAGLPDSLDVKTVFGNSLHITNTGGKVMFGKATVTLSDVTAGNGVVHAIDEVLFSTPQPSNVETSNVDDILTEMSKFDTSKLTVSKKDNSFRGPMKNLVDLCRDLGYTSFAAAMTLTGLDKVVRHEGSFTIFAPTNEAFDHPDNYPGTFKLSDRVRFHIGRGLVKQTSIRDEDQIMTLLNKRKIKFNIYQGKDQNGVMQTITTANGREVSFTGHEAHNGIVHELVTSGMDYVYSVNGTLGKEISAFPQFSTFIDLIQTQFGGILEHTTAFPMTVLVPTNRVLDAALETSSPTEVGQRLLTKHFIPKTWYTIGMDFTGEFTTLGGNKLTLSESVNGGYEINGVPLEKYDFTTSNGAFHQIGGLL
jgi:transforming growth factor-beta-induced protein